MFDVNILQSWEDFKAVKEYSKQVNSKYCVVDLETDGVLEKTANIYGVAFCYNTTETFYIPIRNPQTHLLWTNDQLAEIKAFVAEQGKLRKLVGHNIIYDALVLKHNWGVDVVADIYSDTILLKHAIDENPPFGLKEIAVQHIGAHADKAQKDLLDNIKKNGGRTTKEHMEMFKADTEVLGTYACHDVGLTAILFEKFEARLHKEGLAKLFYEEEIMPVYREVVIPMKEEGFQVNLEHFQKLKSDIETELVLLEDKIYEQIKDDVRPFESQVVQDDLTISPRSAVGKMLLTYKIIPDASALATQLGLRVAYDFYCNKHKQKYVFNLNSTKHLSWLFYECFKMPVEERTPSGAPKLSADVLEEMSTDHPIAKQIVEYKKLQKLLGTYVEGILDRQHAGVIYASMLLFGTTSGRFASRNPNLNNLPAAKGGDSRLSYFTNQIRKGFVAKPGHKIIGSDWESLEPHIAAFVSKDQGLIDIFVNGWDFYSAIGIKQFGITDATPHKDDFGKKYKSLRSKVKTYSLAAFYGATSPRIAQVLGCDNKEAQELLDGYFKAYPGVKTFIDDTHLQVVETGIVKTQLGRIRHIPEAKQLFDAFGWNLLDWKWANKHGKKEQRSAFRNYLNNAVNFQIQGLAAHALNRAMLKMTREFKKHNVQAMCLLSVHDEVLVQASEAHVEQACRIVKQCMEDCIDLGQIKLKADPVVGNSYGEAK